LCIITVKPVGIKIQGSSKTFKEKTE